MESLLIVGFIIAIVLMIAGAIWVGRKIDHPVLLTIGTFAFFIISIFVTSAFIEKYPYIGVPLICLAPVATYCATIIMIIRVVREKKAEKEQYKRDTELEDAVERSDIQAVRQLIEKGADVYCDLLEIAVEKRNKEIVSLLLEKLLENGVSIVHNRSLVTAVKNNDKEIAVLLIEKGSDVNLPLPELTPLDYAKDDDIISILKSHGAKTKLEIEAEARELYNLAIDLEEGKNIAKNPEKAVELYEKAADMGHVASMINLGACYCNGEGIAKNEEKGLAWLEKAASKGSASAQLNLYSYNYNHHLYHQAFEWCKKAAEQGYIPAYYELGLLYTEENFLNYQKAGEWLKKAAEEGIEKAREKLDELHQKGLY